ncbi:rho GTPase-activating protein 2 [Nicotiana tabacum]|uniref:Rho GTPase-activating protein 2 n=1 Tax=Nicotiana tabacum TaxID=4097 RepID=A0A1S3XT81_TOBAC|nr:PREDICTED: rho GTPase-activating protein 2-like [Nicotiana tabacum]
MTGLVMVTRGGGCGNVKSSSKESANTEMQNQQQLSLVDFILAALRKSMVSCRVERQEEAICNAVHQMEIGWPTNVQHLTHVTFDRFHGFLGLPVEFEVEIPCRVPSASVSVFGVSAESMQCSYDTRGNSVPTILLLMQERLYSHNGLKAEGIFRINPENSKEEHVRDQLNRGIVPDDIDVHCLAGLIKAWFRELPSGVLDGLSPEQVLQCNTEEEFVELVKQLKPTETALLNWAIDLMADVVEQEESNKMNARNIAMVFAPNMTQMSDPLTALMHAVQVMNLLKTLIMKTLRERGETEDGDYSPMSSRSSGRQQTDEEFDSQQEEMDTSCESTGPASDDDDEQRRYSYSSEERDEVESLSEIEESFLRQLDENEHAKNDFRKQLEGILCRENVISLTAASTDNGDSSILFSDSKIETSGLSTSDGEDSKDTSVTMVHKAESKRSSTGACGSMEDINMVDVNMAESAVPVQ